MATELITNLRGPRGVNGVQGAVGPQGLPSSETLPADAAVAAYLATAGTSATKTALLGMLPSYNVRHFGAVADGVTDDAPAFQAAITAANGGNVLVPPGDYGIGAEVRLTRGTHLTAYGATMHRLISTNSMVANWLLTDNFAAYDGHGSIVVEGGVWDAHADTIANSGNVFTFDHAKDITVRDVTVRRVNLHHAIELNAIDGALVENCVFEGWYDAAGTLIHGESIQLDCASPLYGNSGVKDGTMAKNIQVVGCVGKGYGAMGAAPVLVGSHYTTPGLLFENVQIIGCRSENSLGSSISGQYWRNAVVSDFVSNNAGDRGIWIGNSERVTVIGAVVVNPVNKGILFASVSRGSITGCTVSGVVVAEGIVAATSDAVQISGNVVRNAKTYGIAVILGSTNCSVKGNGVHGAGYATGALGAIRVSGASSGTSISGNTVRPHGAGTDVDAAVSIHTDSVDAWVHGNDFLGMASAISGTASTTSNRV